MLSGQPELITSEVNPFWETRNRTWAMNLSAKEEKR